MPRLFHVSEEPEIAIFEPRPVGGWDERVAGLAVWAIDEEHLPSYLLPRDCPRVTYACDATATAADRNFFFGPSRADRIIAIEPAWLEPATNTPIFLYAMRTRHFQLVDNHAGHFVSREAVRPIAVTKIENPLAELLKRDVEVRLVRDLLALHEAVAHSTLSYSSTKLRNAVR